MGHLINPISFRLGYSRNWGFSGALMESKSQYFYLNSNYWNLLLLFKRIFALQIFEKMGIMFSHLRFIGSQTKNTVIIYLYDGPLQNESFIFYKYLNKYKKLKKSLQYGKKFFKKFFNRAFFSFYYLKTLNLLFDNFINFLFNYINSLFFQLLQSVAFLKVNIKSIDNFYSSFLKALPYNKQIFIRFIMNSLFKKKINYFLFNCLLLDYHIKGVFHKKISNISDFFSLLNLYLKAFNQINKFLFYLKNYNLNLFILIYKKLFRKSNFFNMLKFMDSKNNPYYKDPSLYYREQISDLDDFKLKQEIYTNLNFLIAIFVNSLFETVFLQRLLFYKFFEKLVLSLGKKKKKNLFFLVFFLNFLHF